MIFKNKKKKINNLESETCLKLFFVTNKNLSFTKTFENLNKS